MRVRRSAPDSSGSTYTFTLYGHDPLGGGNFGLSYKEDQDQIQNCLYQRLGLNSTAIKLTSNVSPYEKRQGDLISCGPIMVDDTFKIILGEDLNIQKPYEFGALPLRENHINLAKSYIQNHPARETKKTEEEQFLERNQGRLEKIKTLLADNEAMSSPSTVNSRSVLNFGTSQSQENKQYKKIASLRPEAASTLLKIDEYHQQQFGTSLNTVLGVSTKPQEDVHQFPQGQEQKGAPQPLATFHNEYCEHGVISQSTALDILHLNQYGYGVDQGKTFPSYCLTEIQSTELFSYGERFSHYAFHSTLFPQGILPVGLCTLKNVCILKEKNLSAYDAQLEAKNVSPQFVRRTGPEVRILEPTYHSYTVQVQAQPETQTTLDQLYKTGDGLKQINPESLSALIISHLLTGSKASLEDYLLLPAEPGKTHLVLPASAHGVYPIIAEIAGGEHASQHISHLTSDLFFIPDLMNQPLAKPVADKLSQIIPEVVVLDWLAKLEKSNDFYQHWHRQGNISFEAFLDAGLPLGVVKGLPSHMCTTLYKIQQLIKPSADLKGSNYPTHDKMIKELFPAVHTVYAHQQKENAVLGVEQSPTKVASKPLEEILNQYVKLDGRLPDGYYVSDLLQAEKTKDTMALQKVQDAAQDLINGINLNDFEHEEQKKTILTKIAQEFLEQGINGRHESWSSPSFWQSMLFKTDDPDFLKLILGRKAKVNETDKAGNYVLNHLLKANTSLEPLKDCLTVLADHKVALDQKDGKGLTALDIVLSSEYSHFEKAPSLFAHLIKLGAAQTAATLPQEEKIINFYHKIRDTKLWTNDVQEAFEILQYNHPKLAWALAVSVILPKEKELTILEVLEGITQGLAKLKREKEHLEEKILTTEEDDKLTNLEERIGQLSPILNTLKRHSQTKPEQFWKLFHDKPYLKDYCKTSGTKLRGLTLGERTLPEAVKHQLWEKGGKFKRINTHGRRDVGKAEFNGHVLYFKRYPELPGFEYAMDVLHHQVIGYGTPWSDLVKIGNEPFLVTLGIKGQNFHDLLNQNPDKDPDMLGQLETKTLQKLMLMAMLTNPEDQKPDQFIVEEMVGHQDSQGKPLYRLVCVDNDHALTPSMAKVVKDGLEKRVVQVKSLLYCLPQMMANIDNEVKNFFLTLNPVEKFKEWLKDIARMDQLYQDETTPLFSNNEVKQFLHYAEGKDCFVGGIPFRDQMIHGIHDRWVKLRSLLDPNTEENQDRKDKKITLMSLLKELTPEVGSRYGKGFGPPHQNLSTWKRFLAIDGPSYGITPEGRLETTITSSLFLTSQNIPIGEDLLRFLKRNTELTPQKRLEELNNAVDLQQIKMEKNKDLAFFNTLTTSTQRSTFLKSSMFQDKPVDVQETFLKRLAEIYKDQDSLENAPHHLYLQGLKTLTSTWLLQKIVFDNISILNLSNCPQILDKFPNIAEKCKSLTQLILHHLPELKSIENSDFLELKNLDLSQCPKLESLDVKAPKLKRLEASKCPSLANVKLNTPKLRVIDLSHDKKVSEADFSAILVQSSKLKKIHLQGCDNLPYAKITELDPFYPVALLEKCRPENKPKIIKGVEKILEGKGTLKIFWLWRENIGDAGTLCLLPALNANTTITSLNLEGNQITDVRAKDLGANTTLTSLNLARNNITDVSALARNTTLTSLYLSHNQIRVVSPFARNTTLTSLNLGDNKITNVSPFARNSTLTSLTLDWNKITDVSPFAHNTTLTSLNLTKNKISDVSAFARNTTLTSLYLAHNQIRVVSPFARNTTLISLNLWANQITDVSPFAHNTTLTELDLGCNNITDVSPFARNTTLTSLDLGGNQITDAGKQLIKEMLERNQKLAPKVGQSQPLPSQEQGLLTDHRAEQLPVPLTATLQNRQFQFVQHPLPEGSDAGLHGLGLDRGWAVQQLLRARNDASVRTLFAPEIKAAFKAGKIPLGMQGDWYHRLHKAYAQGGCSGALNTQLDEYSTNTANYSFFIREYFGGGAPLTCQLGPTSAIDALASLNHLTVHIWEQPSPQKPTLKWLRSTAPYGEPSIHWLYSAQGSLSKLEAIAVPSVLSDLPFNSQISLFAVKEMLPQIKNPDSFFQNLSAKMKEHYTGKNAAEEEKWQKSFDQMRSTLLSENQVKDANQSLLNAPQNFQVKTSNIDTKNHFFTGLSLDGGGIRGLVPAVMLRDFQREARNYTKRDIHIHEMFDYIGGTSVGGILALGLTAPHEKIPNQPLKTLDEMVDLFKNEGSTIFQRTFWGSYMPAHDLFKPKFTPQGLEVFLESNFGDLPVSSSLTPIVVTAVNHTKAPLEGFLFDTSMARLHPDHNFLMRDVGRATSAAQTYFPEACIWNLPKTISYKFSDGGPWLNNPSGVVYNKILKNFPHASHQNIMMVSLGTGEAQPEYDLPTTEFWGRGQGEIGWMKPLIYGQMNLSTFGVDLAMQETLGNNYIRFQPKIVDQSGALKEADLADYTPKLLEEYMAIASKEFETYIKAHEDFIRNLIEKRAQRKDPF